MKGTVGLPAACTVHMTVCCAESSHSAVLETREDDALMANGAEGPDKTG